MLNGDVVSMMSKQQALVALSTMEVEYMATTHTCKEVVWMKNLCSDIGFSVGKIIIFCDNQSVNFFVKNPTFHAKMKHIDVQYHFLQDVVEDRKVSLEKLDTLENVANALMKLVNIDKYR